MDWELPRETSHLVKIVSDNIDTTIKKRDQTKDNPNADLYRVHLVLVCKKNVRAGMYTTCFNSKVETELCTVQTFDNQHPNKVKHFT